MSARFGSSTSTAGSISSSTGWNRIPTDRASSAAVPNVMFGPWRSWVTCALLLPISFAKSTRFRFRAFIALTICSVNSMMAVSFQNSAFDLKSFSLRAIHVVPLMVFLRCKVISASPNAREYVLPDAPRPLDLARRDKILLLSETVRHDADPTSHEEAQHA